MADSHSPPQPDMTITPGEVVFAAVGDPLTVECAYSSAEAANQQASWTKGFHSVTNLYLLTKSEADKFCGQLP